MRIESIHVENFKSLVDFKISLAKLSCLIGLNGAGKSTVLQFIDFLSQLVRGDMQRWLDERKWRSTDVLSKLTPKDNLKFSVQFVDDHDQHGQWHVTYNPESKRCVHESLLLENHDLETTSKEQLELGSDEKSVWITDWNQEKKTREIVFDYSGSILSALKHEVLPVPILEFKKFLVSIKSLDLLTPTFLRQRTRESSGTLGLGGQNLASFIHELGEQKRHELRDKLRAIYPQLRLLESKSLRSGWKQLEIVEVYRGPRSGLALTTQAQHINDGMLRLIAILAEVQSNNRFLLFDEIENGINPEIIEFVIDELVHAEQQILVTTHSPMILNYLEDDVATQGVIYLYKTKEGHTKSIPFFSIPSLAEKLTMMGPGEAFVDTDLTHLSHEIEQLAEAP